VIHQAKKAGGSTNCIEKIIVPTLIRIGEGWENESVALSQVYMSGRICEDLVDAIMPPAASGKTGQPAMAIALLEDYHSLGKRIIYSALRANGLDLADWGRIEADELVAKVIDDDIQILLISVLMLPSALRIKTVRERLQQKKAKTRIFVGGAPFRFDPQLLKEVGADATGENTSEAVEIVTRMIKELS